ncbi:MAG: 30S ribosomal protein S27ae [Halobacteria archaeon]
MGDKKERERRITRAYKTEGGKIGRQRDNCPRCGPGVFMAAHEGRKSCGKCGYTEFPRA